MPTLWRGETFRIEVRSREHPPPHFHVVLADGRDCLIEISTLTRLRGAVPLRTLAQALRWADANRDLLAARWKELNP